MKSGLGSYLCACSVPPHAAFSPAHNGSSSKSGKEGSSRNEWQVCSYHAATAKGIVNSTFEPSHSQASFCPSVPCSKREFLLLHATTVSLVPGTIPSYTNMASEWMTLSCHCNRLLYSPLLWPHPYSRMWLSVVSFPGYDGYRRATTGNTKKQNRHTGDIRPFVLIQLSLTVNYLADLYIYIEINLYQVEQVCSNVFFDRHYILSLSWNLFRSAQRALTNVVSIRSVRLHHP